MKNETVSLEAWDNATVEERAEMLKRGCQLSEQDAKTLVQRVFPKGGKRK